MDLSSATFLEEMYDAWRRDPESVRPHLKADGGDCVRVAAGSGRDPLQI